MPVIPAPPPAPPAPAPPRSFFPVAKLTPKFVLNVAATQSPITLSTQRQSWNANLMAFSVGLAPMQRDKAADVQAAIMDAIDTGPLMFGPVGEQRYPRGDANILPVNLLPYPERFSSWATTTGVTVTENAIADPNGNLTADRIDYDGSGVAGSYRIFSGPAFLSTAGQAYTDSIYLRSVTGTVTVELHDNFGNVTVANLTTAWQRFTVTGTSAGVGFAQLLIYSPTGVNTAFSIYVASAQMEYGSTASAYQTPPYVSVAAAAGASSIQIATTLISRTAFKKWDYLQIGNHLYVVRSADVVTDASGHATLKLFPTLRAAANVGDAIIFSAPQGQFWVVGNTVQPDLAAGDFTSLGFDIVEAF